jgi:hypothetical protein
MIELHSLSCAQLKQIYENRKPGRSLVELVGAFVVCPKGPQFKSHSAKICDHFF